MFNKNLSTILTFFLLLTCLVLLIAVRIDSNNKYEAIMKEEQLSKYY